MTVNGDSDPTLQADSPRATDRLGPYHLLQILGEGGMGEVWVAEQREPIRRTVAVKIIKLGMNSRQVVARFNAERQALAVMDHPAIAKVLDAGTTDEGRPYFVMEYVRGEPITGYCDRQRLSTPDRLELFVRVCEGVQHAHQKGIIHRDLKPSNVLVTIQDGQPVPKIIDFGIAKATAHQFTEQTVFTELGVLIGTPEYMSPEQAEMTGLDIDTRTDIYSLGVLLYELLTGTLPFDRKELRAKALDEIRRIIRDTDPPRPSTRITQLGAACAEAAKNRLTEPARLAGQLRGDLDWITMRALEKDRTRRYDSATALARDVQRHLHDDPVVAGPPAATYRVKKFVRRHRLGVAAAATLVIMLLAVAASTAVQAQRIARERDRASQEAQKATQVSAFLVELFEVTKPSEAVANSVTAREILDRGADRIHTDLRGQPEVQAALMGTIGEAYNSLGLYKNAELLQRERLRVLRQTNGLGSPEAAASMVSLAHTLERQARFSEAQQLSEQAIATLAKIHTPEGVKLLADATDGFAWVTFKMGKLAEAEALTRKARALYESLPTVTDAQRARCLGTLGAILFEKGDLSGAEQALADALKHRRLARGPGHPSTMSALASLATVWIVQRKYAAAETAYIEIVASDRKRLGPDHVDLATDLNNLGAILFFQRKYDEAEKSYREALSINMRALGGRHPSVGTDLTNIGQVLSVQAKYDEAERVLREALQIKRDVLGEDHAQVGVTLTFLADSLCRAGRALEAEVIAQQALSLNRRQVGNDHRRTKEAEGALACALMRQKRYSAAEPLLLSYATALENTAGVEGDPQDVAQRLATLYERWRKPEKAAEWRARAATRTASQIR